VKKSVLLRNALLVAAVTLFSCSREPEHDAWAAGDKAEIPVLERAGKKEYKQADPIIRGSLLKVSSETVTVDGVKYVQATAGERKILVPEKALATNPRETVREKELFVQTGACVIDDTLSSHIGAFARKGDCLEVLGFDRLQPDGRVHRYNVRAGKTEGWFFGKYAVITEEEAQERFDKFDDAHKAVRNSFKGGEAIGCEFRPYEKPSFADNPMPQPVNAFYLTISPAGLKRIDDYIALADSTRINAFVIDIKDDQCPG